MKNAKNKTIAIALFLMFALAVSLFALPDTNAQSSKKTYAYIGAAPNPVGVNQQVLLHIGISAPTAGYGMQDGWEGLTVTVTRPDGKTETLGSYMTDPTGGTGDVYIPTMEGNYTFQTHFPEQVQTVGAQGTPAGTIMLASDSEKITLVVQADPIPYYPGHALPTEYWTRPINAQLREWTAIAGNWLESPANYFAPNNDDAPEAGHILWTKPLATGGLVGGDLAPYSMEIGDAYEQMFSGPGFSPVIIGGVLYYNQYKSQGGTKVEQDVVAVDLHTGEEVWRRNWNNTRLSMGQTFLWESFNYHGAFTYLWTKTGNTWDAYEAFTGRWIYRMTDIPSGGTTIRGPNGEFLTYIINLNGGFMSLWNSTKVITYGRTGFAAGSWINNDMGTIFNATRGNDWNVSIPLGLPGSVQAVLKDRVLGASIDQYQVTVWGLSLEEGREGTLLFKKTWTPPSGNLTLAWAAASVEDGIFVITARETRLHYGFNIDNGEPLWSSTEPQHYMDQYLDTNFAIAYGKLFSVGWGGVVYCYDNNTGNLLWTYAAHDKLAEARMGNNWPLRIAFIADGKIYVLHMEHSPDNPLPRGAPFFCLDVETGEEVWSLNIRGTAFRGALIGDSIMVMYNSYDQLIYAIGKGPSATTVTAPDLGVSYGKPVLVKGMVTDVSPGTKDAGLTMRFPNGVPAVSDANMSDWMQYVHMQFERPADVVGVDVVVSVLDPNNNCYEVARTTSDASGFFSAEFTPEVPGKYTVIATFEGSRAYYGSSAETALLVEEAPADTPVPTPVPQAPVETYFTVSTIAIIAAIAVAVILMLRKR